MPHERESKGPFESDPTNYFGYKHCKLSWREREREREREGERI